MDLKKKRGTAPPAVPRCERSRYARKRTDFCQRVNTGLRRKDKLMVQVACRARINGPSRSQAMADRVWAQGASLVRPPE